MVHPFVLLEVFKMRVGELEKLANAVGSEALVALFEILLLHSWVGN
jgi:hypothetical protein